MSVVGAGSRNEDLGHPHHILRSPLPGRPVNVLWPPVLYIKITIKRKRSINFPIKHYKFNQLLKVLDSLSMFGVTKQLETCTYTVYNKYMHMYIVCALAALHSLH